MNLYNKLLNYTKANMEMENPLKFNQKQIENKNMVIKRRNKHNNNPKLKKLKKLKKHKMLKKTKPQKQAIKLQQQEWKITIILKMHMIKEHLQELNRNP